MLGKTSPGLLSPGAGREACRGPEQPSRGFFRTLFGAACELVIRRIASSVPRSLFLSCAPRRALAD